MNIAVCVKRVPDMELRFSIGADRRSLDQAGLKFDLSDFDGYALDPAYALATLAAAAEAGADWLVLCDTNGGALPDFVAATVRRLRR